MDDTEYRQYHSRWDGSTHLHHEEAAVLRRRYCPLGVGLGQHHLGRDGFPGLEGHQGLLPLRPSSLDVTCYMV